MTRTAKWQFFEKNFLENLNVHNFCLNYCNHFIFSGKQDINKTKLPEKFHATMTSQGQMTS